MTTLARANFNSGGIVGSITFTQVTVDASLNIAVNITTFDVNNPVDWMITQHPVVDVTIPSPCTGQQLGNAFDPCINSIDPLCLNMVTPGMLSTRSDRCIDSG